MKTKLITRKKPEIHNGKVKRTGETYYEAWYWTGSHWNYKEFSIRKEAISFLKQYAQLNRWQCTDQMNINNLVCTLSVIKQE